MEPYASRFGKHGMEPSLLFWMYDQEYEVETLEPKLYLKTEAYLLEATRQFCQTQFEHWLKADKQPMSLAHEYAMLELAEHWHTNMLDAEYMLFMLGG